VTGGNQLRGSGSFKREVFQCHWHCAAQQCVRTLLTEFVEWCECNILT
jgi:hypothetical protein